MPAGDEGHSVEDEMNAAMKADPRFKFAAKPEDMTIFQNSKDVKKEETAPVKQDDWHWDEKDLGSYVNMKLEEFFKEKQFLEEGSMTIKTYRATIDDESSAFLSRRKGQLFCTYNMNFKIMWYGRIMIGSSIVGDGRGKVTINDVSYDNEDPESWVAENEFDRYGGGACLNPQMKTRDLIEYEVQLDEAVTKTVLPLLRSKVHDIVKGFAVLLEKAKKGEKVLGGNEDKPLNNEKVDDAASNKRAEDYVRELHRKTVGKKYYAYTAGGNTEAKVSLSCSSINDEDLADVIKVLQQDDIVEELDLSFNDIKDSGLQQLCAALGSGAGPRLKKLRITHNQISDMAKRMLTGLKFVRKTLEIEADGPDLTPAK
jgi:hypothetical protein